MKILNLDQKFKPFGIMTDVWPEIEFQKFSFPSGCEPHIKLPEFIDLVGDSHVRITTRIATCNDIILLMLCVDALRRSGVKRLELFIPYLPFARQDRVMVPGEPLSVKVMADMINTMKFDIIKVYDVHSEVSLALIDNCTSISNAGLVQQVLHGKENYLIISPDAGAYKKIFKLCQEIKYEGEIIMCNKIRDVKNGVIRSLTVSHEDLGGKDVYIVDDICDGGGTFTLLAEVLRTKNCGKIHLIVSHGIFSKGVEALVGVDHIYTTDSFKTMEHNNNLTQFNLCDILS